MRARGAAQCSSPRKYGAAPRARDAHIESGRLSTYERPKRPGLLKVAADTKEGVVVGAVAVGPEAGEWIGQLTLAVRARVPIDTLLDTIQPYPTFSEAIFSAPQLLEERL